VRCDRQPDGSDGHVLKIECHVLKDKLKEEIEAAIRGYEGRRGRTTGSLRSPTDVCRTPWLRTGLFCEAVAILDSQCLGSHNTQD
jgi:hypothetical protein